MKIRGFRVELGEIEATLARHPDVACAAVVVREDATGGDALVAFVEAVPGSETTAELAPGGLPAHLSRPAA